MLYKEKECQKNLAGHFSDKTNPGFIIPDLLLGHLLCTETHNGFVALNIILKRGGEEREMWFLLSILSFFQYQSLQTV